MLGSDHVLLIHPLWNGGAPAILRAFMEQTFRPSFSFPDAPADAKLSVASAFTQRKALTGKSARVITTMQMPGFIHRWLFRPHQEANALWLAGAGPVRQTAIGAIESADPSARREWLRRVFKMGRKVS
jgi:putative NADPH-quinone reductase